LKRVRHQLGEDKRPSNLVFSPLSKKRSKKKNLDKGKGEKEENTVPMGKQKRGNDSRPRGKKEERTDHCRENRKRN